MTNRTGVYIAFSGEGTTDPTKSDFMYYAMLKAWKENKNFDFSLVNSHEKTSQVKDSSSDETLKKTLRDRLNLSKTFLLIVTENTKNASDIVKYEIEYAIKECIPIILAYPDYKLIKNVNEELKKLLPSYLLASINSGTSKTLFIPFKLNAIKMAINFFYFNNSELKNSCYCYKQIETWD